MALVTLTNDFHNTSIKMRLDVKAHISGQAVELDSKQMKSAKNRLCGVKGCCCGGIRGRQSFNEKPLSVEWSGE